MRADTSLPRLLRLAPVLLVALTSLFASAPRAAAEPQRPTAHELAAIAAAGGERLWYHEEEFLRDPLLRAKPHQVVILDLEPGAGGRRPLRNTIPYHFEETAIFTFCLPQGDAHLRSLTLIEEESREVVVYVPRGGQCKQRTIAAGRYQLVMFHDVRGIEGAGKKAFIHVPRFKGAAPAENTENPRAAEGTPVTSTASSLPVCDPTDPFNSALLTLTVAGKFISSLDEGKVSTQSTPPDALAGWYICPDGGGNYTIFRTGGPYSFSASGPPSTDTTIYVNYPPTPFKLTDLGNNQFTLAANFSGTPYPVVLGADNVLHWAPPGAAPAVFTIALKYYPLTVTAQPLQSGEAALFQACNYDVSSTGTWVFTTSVSDFGAFRAFGATLDNTVASVKVGPQTIATLYADINFGGTAQVVGRDIPCLSATPLGVNTASSLRVTPARQFVVATNECQNCNLSGVDLSDLDLSGGQFQGSTFTGATLANASLQGASLDSANLNGAGTVLTGANFVSALLHCTNFSGADLSQAVVLFSGIRPIVTTDFSCRVDLAGATFNLNSFPLAQWRYFNLTGAKINSITGATLSTTASPLDLSGVVLNQAVLPQVHLDGANLGCASTASGGSVCTQLIGTNLNKASLRRANLAHASLGGADLNSANLDGANLFAANLTGSGTGQLSATLQGAFLRNVNLATANLTGANLSSANFYSTGTVSTCNSAAADGFLTSCASAVNAQLKNTVFIGAYLAGVDFTGSAPQSANFRGAYLAGSHFTKANLTQDTPTGLRTDFTGAWLQGTTFTNATVTGANFTGAVVDLTNSRGATLTVQLSSDHLTFPNYTASGTPGCVAFTYNSETVVPATDSSNVCPDGNFPLPGEPCTTGQWQAISPPAPPSCTLDFNWIFVNY